MKLEPLLDRVIIKPTEAPDNLTGGLVVPSSPSSSDKRYGKIVAVSHGVPTAEGDLRKLCVKKGDRVVYDPEHAVQIRDGEETLHIVREDALLAILK